MSLCVLRCPKEGLLRLWFGEADSATYGCERKITLRLSFRLWYFSENGYEYF